MAFLLSIEYLYTTNITSHLISLSVNGIGFTIGLWKQLLLNAGLSFPWEDGLFLRLLDT